MCWACRPRSCAARSSRYVVAALAMGLGSPLMLQDLIYGARTKRAAQSASVTAVYQENGGNGLEMRFERIIKATGATTYKFNGKVLEPS